MTLKTQIEAVLTFENFTAWLKTRDPAETYDYWNSDDCLVSRFLRAQGITEPFAVFYNGVVPGLNASDARDYYERVGVRHPDGVPYDRRIDRISSAGWRSVGAAQTYAASLDASVLSEERVEA